MVWVDAIAELLWDEAPPQAQAIALIDCPDLVPAALERAEDVRVWCDDWRTAQQVPVELLVSHPDELACVDLALARLPKSLAALDEQVASVQGSLELTFLGGAKIKHLNRSMNEVLGRYFAAVSASLERKKTRVLRAWGPEGGSSEWPKFRNHPDLDLVVAAHGATFGGNKVDAGTRLLLGNLNPTGSQVLDLGCGNGVIAAWLAKRGFDVQARDVSWSAVAATNETAAANNLGFRASWGDGLSGFEPDSFDVIVTNPPFHRGVAKDSADTLAWFEAAGRILRSPGEFWCVFNSHLPWRQELNQRLGPTKVVAQDRSYTVTLTRV